MTDDLLRQILRAILGVGAILIMAVMIGVGVITHVALSVHHNGDAIQGIGSVAAALFVGWIGWRCLTYRGFL